MKIKLNRKTSGLSACEPLRFLTLYCRRSLTQFSLMCSLGKSPLSAPKLSCAAGLGTVVGDGFCGWGDVTGICSLSMWHLCVGAAPQGLGRIRGMCLCSVGLTYGGYAL
ncbi:MAG TPA: hypothetical protein VN456_14935 [Desulfosporosinus sp.]|nr:hypothetical protein [Desulfosporosinus sp.]